MARKKFLIVGLGLLGGSLALAIQKKFPQAKVLGLSREKNKITLAKKKFIHEGSAQLSKIVPQADFVIICSPVDTVPGLVFAIDRFAQKGTIATDVGSTKAEMIKKIERKKLKNVQFVGSHPLAGSHLTGLKYAKRDLFNQAFVFVTPTKKTNRKAVSFVSDFWNKLNTRVRILSPERHDRVVSQISHVPHAIASVLMNSVDSKTLNFAGTGFRDTTRIAEGDPRLWIPIFLANKKNLARDLNHFERRLKKLIALLKHGSKSSLTGFLKKASSNRAKI